MTPEEMAAAAMLYKQQQAAQPPGTPAPAAPVQPVVAPVAQVQPVAPVVPVTTPLEVGVVTEDNTELATLRKQVAQQNVYMAAGGKDQFDAMSEWAKTGLDAETKTVLNSALKAGTPEVQAFMIKSAMSQFKAATKASSTPAVNLIVGDTTPVGAPVNTQGLGSREYSAQYKAFRRAGKDPNSPEILALDARRGTGIAQGLA